MKFLIVGLGNIGAEYELTRHNIGFLILDQLADQFNAPFELDRHGYKAQFKYKGKQITLIKPTTYMNLSGKATNYWLAALKIPKEKMLIVTDDLALPFGTLRMRAKGSNAGHNGLKSIEALTGGANYPRLRFGIGNDFKHGQQIDFVLEKFSSEEFDNLEPLIKKSCEMVLSFCAIGINQTMNQFNT
jgi:PTH1 family peptidyl-tRNA hydrolase